MRKTFKMLCVWLAAALFIFCAGMLIFIKTFNVSRYKPQIIAGIKKAIGRQVEFADIALRISFKNGLQLSLADLNVGEHPDFGKGDFLKVKSVRLGISLGDVIFKRQIRVLNIEAQSPHLTIIRLKDERINAQNFAQVQPQDAKHSSPPMKGPDVKSPAAFIPAVFINRISFSDGTLRYIDYSFEPGLELEFKRISFRAADISLTKPFELQMQAAFLSLEPNIEIEAKAEADILNSGFSLKDCRINISLSSLDTRGLLACLPQLSRMPLFEIGSGDVNFLVRELRIGPQGLSLTLDAALKNGQVTFPEIYPGISLSLKDIGFNAQNLSLSEDFTFNLEAAYLSKAPNLRLQAKAGIDLDKQELQIKNAQGQLDLSSLSMKLLSDSLYGFKSIPLPDELKGQLGLNVKQIAVGAGGMRGGRSILDLKNGFIRLKELLMPVESIEAAIVIEESSVELEKLSASFGNGRISLSGGLKDFLNTQGYSFKAQAQGLSIADCLNQKSHPIRINGLVFGDLELKGAGFDPEKLFSRLSAKGALEVKEASLSNINILKTVLDKLSIMPDLAQALEANLSGSFKERLSRKNTVLTMFKLNLSVNNGILSVESLYTEADGFVFKGTGKADLSRNYEFDGIFSIPSDLTSRIVSAAAQMELLRNQEGQISFPLKISGKGAEVSFMPDIGAMGAVILRNKAQQELQNVLRRVFDRSSDSRPDNRTTDTNKPGGSSEASRDTPIDQEAESAKVEENDKKEPGKIIRSILEAILSK